MKKVATLIAKLSFWGLLLYYLIDYYLQHQEEFSTVVSRFGITDLSIALFFVTLGYAFIAILWSPILSFFTKKKFPLLSGFAATTISWLGKYIPGKVWMIGMRVYYTRHTDITPAETSFVTVFDAIYFHFVGVVLTTLLFPYTVYGDLIPLHPSLFALTTLLLMILLHPKIWMTCITKLSQLLKINMQLYRCRYRDLLFVMFVNILSYLFWTLSLIALFPEDIALSARDFLSLFVGMAMAYVGGFVVLIAPAGLGVRDGILVFALKTTLGLPTVDAIVFTAGYRFVSTIAEMILAALGFLIVSRKREG